MADKILAHFALDAQPPPWGRSREPSQKFRRLSRACRRDTIGNYEVELEVDVDVDDVRHARLMAGEVPIVLPLR